MNNYCIRHRHETDHDCASLKRSQAEAAPSSQNKNLNEKRLNFFQNHFQKQPEIKQSNQPQNVSRNTINNFQASNMVNRNSFMRHLY